MPNIKESAESYRQAYLNAKTRKAIEPRIFFKQSNNNTELLRSGKGRYGDGFYTAGALVDRNDMNPPTDSQHSTSPELIMDKSEYTDKQSAMDRGFVGVDIGDGVYYLFPETVQSIPKSESVVATHQHPLKGTKTPIEKRGRKWYIDGNKKGFKSKDAARKHLEADLDFLNA